MQFSRSRTVFNIGQLLFIYNKNCSAPVKAVSPRSLNRLWGALLIAGGKRIKDQQVARSLW